MIYILCSEACGNVAPFVRIAKYWIVPLIKVFLPVFLIVLIMIDLVKCVTATDDKIIKKNLGMIAKRVLYLLICFIVFTITKNIFNTATSSGSGDPGFMEWIDCWNTVQEDGNDGCTTTYDSNDVTYDSPIYLRNSSNLKDLFTVTHDFYQYSSTNGGLQGSNRNGTNFTYYNQGDGWGRMCDTSRTIQGSGCGVCSFAIIANQFSGETVTPTTLRNFYCPKGVAEPNFSHTFFTNPILLNRYNLKVETLETNGSSTYNEKVANNVFNAVASGKGVVLNIPGHYVVVGQNTSCKSNQVYLYEVGHYQSNGCYTIRELWNLTWNNKNRCTSQGACGWYGIWAYSSR